ncbi:ribokinase [Alkalicoccus halolimnae]|uniref:Ribokinase n=1 Tax=Alkalicoccus halolimnae TaxID=1667239 RepID=A0A5C7FE47_9BACI|nr:ribokinase [Alkalicoccus halolimnae]TXF85577.1 ribokinase [Alkalicoccus halolimnae]
MPDVLIVGSYITDLTARTAALPKPGETVIGTDFQTGPGGKGGNQAAAAARLGSEVVFVTKIGRDAFGEQAKHHFMKEGIADTYIIETEEAPTGTALIAVDDKGENMIVVTPGACGHLSAGEVEQAEKVFEEAPVLLLQLETGMGAVEKAAELAFRKGAEIILNPAPYRELPDRLLQKVTYLTPNETEAEEMTGVAVTDKDSAEKAAAILLSRGVSTVIITLGRKGCFVMNNYEKFTVSGEPVKAVDTTGAGDAFNGALAHFISTGMELHEACLLANRAAAVSVTRTGTAPAMARLEELKRL